MWTWARSEKGANAIARQSASQTLHTLFYAAPQYLRRRHFGETERTVFSRRLVMGKRPAPGIPSKKSRRLV
jgi:hypothetical protein